MSAPKRKAVNRTLTKSDDKRDKLLAKVYNEPTLNAARVFLAVNPKAGLDLGAVAGVLAEHTGLVRKGDLSRVEDMLVTQAHALEQIFTRLSERAQAVEYMSQFQGYMALALKAQSQCRATIEALVEIKYPRHPTFVRQQNVAVNQQINNGEATTPRARGEISKQANELFEAQPHARLDARATGATTSVDSCLAPVGAIDGPENTRR